MKPLIAVFFGAAFVFGGIAIQPVLADSGDYIIEPIGFPRSTGTMKMTITIDVNGQKTTKNVTIPSGQIVSTTSLTRNPGETNQAFAQRIMDNRSEYSYQKALVIASAINSAFSDQFTALGQQATVGFTPVSNTSPGNKILQEGLLYQGPPVTASYGSIQIPSVSKDKNMASITFTENKVLGEGGNGGRFLPGMQPSPGTSFGMTWATPGLNQVASGVDSYGDPSEVDFGIEGQYVATVTPTMGMSDVTIMQLLAAQLNAHNEYATYSDELHELSLDQPVQDGQTMIWGNTDTDLEFTTSFQGLSEPVPEPAAETLLAFGAISMTIFGRFSRHCRLP